MLSFNKKEKIRRPREEPMKEKSERMLEETKRSLIRSFALFFPEVLLFHGLPSLLD
jgi:hypothetical protein